ncbi:MAG TPA: hydroxyacylglutathione hydrolase [Motiliproteus sp.]
MLQVQPVAAFQDNYIWMLGVAGSQEVAAVDPGDAAPVLAWLETQGKQLSAILITHHHPDHTDGVAELCQGRDIPVYGPADSPFKGVTKPLQDNDQITLFGQQFQIKATPGHTLDHICYYLGGDQPQLFCGDTLFLAGCGRLFEGEPTQMQKAMDYFATLPDNTEVYCTHEYSLANLAFAAAVEPENSNIQAAIERCTRLRAQHWPTLPTHIAEEKRINPFMRCHSESVVESAYRRSGERVAPGCPTLTVIRAWKNVF